MINKDDTDLVSFLINKLPVMSWVFLKTVKGFHFGFVNGAQYLAPKIEISQKKEHLKIQ